MVQVSATAMTHTNSPSCLASVVFKMLSITHKVFSCQQRNHSICVETAFPWFPCPHSLKMFGAEAVTYAVNCRLPRKHTMKSHVWVHLTHPTSNLWMLHAWAIMRRLIICKWRATRKCAASCTAAYPIHYSSAVITIKFVLTYKTAAQLLCIHALSTIAHPTQILTSHFWLSAWRGLTILWVSV